MTGVVLADRGWPSWSRIIEYSAAEYRITLSDGYHRHWVCRKTHNV